MLEIKINNEKAVLDEINKFSQGLDDLSPLMRQVAGTMHTAVMQNFQQGGRPAWLGLKHRSGKPLVDTGMLQNSINAHHDKDTAVVGTNLDYAQYHQFGTKPYTIYPKNKKALYWNGALHPVKKVNHPGLAARPFLTLTEYDEESILDDGQNYFRSLVK